ncbi:alpha/beta knot [Rhizodiscina lignyota]|uniref:Alpha/beta knot n=1 Tax=Rhizodiscina lignyota TaxID=1504668 RepID=A0A9P4MBG9_9PEZI|nr:alpha/beta knot [Rhizodiscina lignyota]
MAAGRAHNGVILDASPLPRWTIAALGETDDFRRKPDEWDTIFRLFTSRASNKQELSSLSYRSDGWRYPLVLCIDDVLDPGNLGAIIRSAYFLGVDALAIDHGTCAPPSNVALKASAGAAEVMPLLSIESTRNFLAESKKNGWSIYAGMTPEPAPPTPDLASKFSESSTAETASSHPLPVNPSESSTSALHLADAQTPSKRLVDHIPLVQHPCLLLFGGEGRGLRKTLSAHADYLVSMTAAKRPHDVGVDSLNVSVAASVIAAEFLRRPPARTLERERRRTVGADLGF